LLLIVLKPGQKSRLSIQAAEGRRWWRKFDAEAATNRRYPAGALPCL